MGRKSENFHTLTPIEILLQVWKEARPLDNLFIFKEYEKNLKETPKSVFLIISPDRAEKE